MVLGVFALVAAGEAVDVAGGAAPLALDGGISFFAGAFGQLQLGEEFFLIERQLRPLIAARPG